MIALVSIMVLVVVLRFHLQVPEGCKTVDSLVWGCIFVGAWVGPWVAALAAAIGELASGCSDADEFFDLFMDKLMPLPMP